MVSAMNDILKYVLGTGERSADHRSIINSTCVASLWQKVPWVIDGAFIASPPISVVLPEVGFEIASSPRGDLEVILCWHCFEIRGKSWNYHGGG